MASVNPSNPSAIIAAVRSGQPALRSGSVVRTASPAIPKGVLAARAAMAASAPGVAKSLAGARPAPSAATPSPAPPPAPAALLGDVDGDGRVGEADGRALLDYLFAGASAPVALGQADVNGDGSIDIADAMQMIAAESTPAPAPVATTATNPFLLRQATAGYQKIAGLLSLLRP